MYYGKKASAKAIVFRCVIEIILATFISIPLLYIYVFVRGNVDATHRGFFCDDQSLKYPIVDETITNHQCLALWALLSLLIIFSVESLHNAVFPFKPNMELPKFIRTIPMVVFEVYRSLGYLYIGGLFTLASTELAKHQIGRLRPYFFEACQPEYLEEHPCTDINGFQVFVFNYTCNGNPKLVREARKSFLSGHTSFSFFCAIYLIIYLQTRLYHKPDQMRVFMSAKREHKLCLRFLKILQPFLQFGLFVLAVHIALSRISDYKHHSTDVLAGVGMGSMVAVTVSLFLLNLRDHPAVFFGVDHHERDQSDQKNSQDEEMAKL